MCPTVAGIDASSHCVLGMVAWRGSDVSGAGRALPVEAENFVIELFKGINPDIVSTPLIRTL